MPRLTDLDPHWIYDFEPATGGHRKSTDLSVADAQGVLFECPLCGDHSILAYFRDRGVPDDAMPGPGRWTPSGSGFADLSLTPSVDLSGPHPGCQWHGWVTNGEAK